MKKETKIKILKIAITLFIFWALDFFMHISGVGETNYYYISKFGNAVLFSIIGFFIFDFKSHTKKLIFSVIFGTWISFYYLVSSYSGLVQLLGISARYSAPPFVIFGYYLSSFFWWFFHILAYYIGLEVAGLIEK